MEGLHELIDGICSALRPAQGMVVTVRPTKDLLGVLQGLFKSNSDLQFSQAFKGNSQANSGLLSLTRASHSSTGFPLADKMSSWAKRTLSDQKKGLSG